MKVILPANLSNSQKAAINQEVRKQHAEITKQWDSDYEAMMLWVLHTCYGFGKKRLLEFRKAFMHEAQELRNFYEMPEDPAYPAKIKLKEIGIDVDRLLEEEQNNGQEETNLG